MQKKAVQHFSYSHIRNTTNHIKMVNKQYNVQGLNKKMKQRNTMPAPTSPTSTTNAYLSKSNDSVFQNDDFDVVDNCDVDTSKIGSSISSIEHHKDLSINDIGRFQYILQMDRELVRIFHYLAHDSSVH